MKLHFYWLFLFVVASGQLQAQARLTLNNGIHIVLDDSARLVLDNGATNAIATVGSGGMIVSESEADVVQWNIGTGTGTYAVPFGTQPVATGGNGTAIPLEMKIDAPGVGGGSLHFATYETDDVNMPLPAGVTHLSNASGNQSLNVIDRFWIVEPSGFATNPAATFAFTYDDSANELGGSNSANEAQLQAQRWNTITNDWESVGFGTVNTTTNRIEGIAVTASTFFPTWTLVDNSELLPVELLAFQATCNSNEMAITWETASETNNSHFIIEKSYDGQHLEQRWTVEGAGTTSRASEYAFSDPELRIVGAAPVYYRLTQVDFDGQRTRFEWVLANGCSGEQIDIQPVVWPNPTRGLLHFKHTGSEPFQILVRNAQGTLVHQAMNQGEAENLGFLPAGVYHVRLHGNSWQHHTKLVLVH